MLLALTLVAAAAAAPVALRTPPMGWMSWEMFRCEVE
jgi:hypothetical protein